MAEISTKIELKIMDLECFHDLVTALANWAEEMQPKANMSNAEHALFFAAVKLGNETTKD
tara:strand:+ start:742 stop:921 length:180 start_codon:yes stop_codon:yes gene_type:complete